MSGASGVSTSVGSPTYNINAGLALAASITGTVTGAVSGAELPGVCIAITSTDGGVGGSTTSAAGGTYTVLGLAADTYAVSADPSCGGTVSSPYASPQPARTPVTVTPGEALTDNIGLVLPGSVADYITLGTSAPSNASVGGATYSPSATATSGDHVAITLDGTSTGCALNAGIVSFTAVGTCVVDFNDASTGPSDPYASAAQIQQSFSVAAASSGGGGGVAAVGGGGGGAVAAAVAVAVHLRPVLRSSRHRPLRLRRPLSRSRLRERSRTREPRPSCHHEPRTC